MRVYLRSPCRSDAKEFVESAKRSVEMHRPWVYPATSQAGFEELLERIESPRHASFLVCRKSDDRIAGVVNLNEIIEGALRGAFVGYWGFSGFEGKGYMTEGLALAFDEAFGELGLHRLEVNIQPGNLRSLALARRLGLRREGFSPKYLRIGGEWRDHERWALLGEDWLESGGAEMAVARISG